MIEILGREGWIYFDNIFELADGQQKPNKFSTLKDVLDYIKKEKSETIQNINDKPFEL